MRATVVGAGIGGLTTAIGLRDAGWSVTVLERWPDVVGIGAALGLWPQAVDGLDRVGVGDAVRTESVPTGEAGIFRRDGRRLLSLPGDSPRAPAVRLISRRRLMELLLTRADGVEIRTGVAADEAVLRAVLDDADLLVGADGLRSGVRRAFFPDATAPRYSGLMGWRGAVDVETGGYGETWGDGMLFGLTPMEPGRTNFYAAFPAEEDAPGTLEDLRARYAGWRDPIPDTLARAREVDVLRNPIHDLAPALASFVHDGQVALLGDAAHAMTPHAGRGACEAVLDAVALVDHLGSGPDVADALAAYDRERRPAAQKIAARSWTMRRLSHATGARAALRNGVTRAAGLVIR